MASVKGYIPPDAVMKAIDKEIAERDKGRQFYKKEPIIHSHITDVLPENHPLAYKGVYCDHCKETILHCGNNECMQTWIETEFGNYCTDCFKFTDVLESLDENLRENNARTNKSHLRP